MTFICIGHRGACGYEPENTLRSVRKALALGVPWIEIDVYCVAGALLVFHDDRLERVSNGQGLIWSHTVDYLRQLDVGQGERMPLLEEILDCVDRVAGVNIELKGVGTAKPVVDMVKRYIKERHWQPEQFLISSFNHHELALARNYAPEIKRGALTCSIPLDYAKFAEVLGAYSVNVATEFVDAAFVQDAHARGIKVFVYTVNYIDDAIRLKNMGCDGVFSDYPDRIMRGVG
jgi:glycerophosphoryl diester phosphodiesterase